MSRTVTGLIKKTDGTAWAGGVIWFNLIEPFETATEVYPAEKHSVTLDAQGAFSITLGVPATGTAHYEIVTPDLLVYPVYLGAGAATDLMTLLTLASSPVSQDAVQTLIDANSVATIANKTALYTIQAGDEIIRCNGTFAVTLPAATGSGAVYCVKNIGVGTITLTAAAGDLIDGLATQTISSLDWAVILDAAADTWDLI